MDTLSFMIAIHLVALAIACLAVFIRSLPLWATTQASSVYAVSHKRWITLQHLGFSLVVVTGILLLFLHHVPLQPWFYAKIILFLVLLSAWSKAFKKDDSILLVQRRAGLIIGAVALLAIVGLSIFQPVFG